MHAYLNISSKNLSQNYNIYRSLLIDFSDQLMWLWIVINNGEHSSCSSSSSIQIYIFEGSQTCPA